MDKEEKKRKIYTQRQFINVTGKSGSGPGQFTHPLNVAFNWTNRQLVVSDGGNHRLQFIEPQKMKHLRCVGSIGSRPGQFWHPSGLSYQPITDNLLACDYYNHRLQMMNNQDQVVAIIGTSDQERTCDGQFTNPSGVACAPNGQFFVVEQAGNRVQLFDASGRFLAKFGKQGKGDQDLYDPYDISVLDARFAPSSAASSLLLVANFFNQSVSVWRADGSQHIRNIQVKSWARGVCVDLNGFMYVSTFSHTIEVLDPRRDFACLQTIGSYQDSTPSNFNHPSGLCVDHTNTLMVADSGNHRLQFFV